MIIQGGIAYSSMSDLNYNTGAATAIGFGVGFICAALQISLKMKLNNDGIIDSNSVIFWFIIPSFFAAIFAAIAQAVDHTAVTYTNPNGGVVHTHSSYIQAGRSRQSQGGYQFLAWLFAAGFGAVAGVIIGFLYSIVNDHHHESQFFNDAVLFNYPGTEED